MPAPHDAPTTVQLIEAVREFLEAEVLPATGGGLRFHALVAAHVLGMVERELTLGAGHAADHAARLAALGQRDDAALAAAIRSGTLDPHDPALLAALAEATRAKLEVANPGHLG
ncbi:DUF6285 domain-containing protein [Actinocorallia longicatena]|uniref:DUF6285 domain-containing protein n=1 Tax=Actinocorallia longicatena TaxID=111803 RepID=A0ABP6QC79_9ACTN